MPLADDIRSLRDRSLGELSDAHDYYTDTRIAWRMVDKAVRSGVVFNVRKPTTGTLTTHDDLVSRARGYVDNQLTPATFQQFISIFEHFFFDLLRLWPTAYPRNLTGKKVDFEAILEAPDKDAITALVVNKELNEVLYERPTGWFAYLEAEAKLGCPAADEIERIAEAKATRDALVHNRGVASRTYEAKAGRLARYKDGQQLGIPEQYHEAVWQLLRKVIADISNAAVSKLTRP